MKEEERIFILLDRLCSKSARLSVKELQQLYALLSGREEDDRIAAWTRQRWADRADGGEEPDYDHIFNRVQQQIEAKGNGRRRFMQRFYRAAAVLLFPLLGLSGYLCVQTVIARKPVRTEITVAVAAEQEYTTPPGMRSKIILPDSTVVWLNAASRLTVARGFGTRQRNVTLVGEAYFEVARNEQKTFTVGTPGLDIKVLGTAFNLSAYPDEAPSAVLVEGALEATAKSGDNRPLKKVRLKPEQLLKIQSLNQTVDVESDVNTKLYTSWTNGLLVFNKTPMGEVAKTLERWYNVRIVLRDQLLSAYHFTGTFNNRTLEQVMSYLSLSSSIGYAIDREGDTVTIYNQEKI